MYMVYIKNRYQIFNFRRFRVKKNQTVTLSQNAFTNATECHASMNKEACSLQIHEGIKIEFCTIELQQSTVTKEEHLTKSDNFWNCHWLQCPQIPVQRVGQLPATQVITAGNATPVKENKKYIYK